MAKTNTSPKIKETHSNNKCFLQRVSWTYYLLSLAIIAIALLVVQPWIMTVMAKNETHRIAGTNIQIVQTDESIKRYIIPFVYAKSITVAAAIALALEYVITVIYSKKKAFAPLLEEACVLLPIVIALSAVYTWGYDASKEIYDISPEYFDETFAFASGSNDDSSKSVTVISEIKEVNESSDSEVDGDKVEDNTKSSAESEGYITAINGKKTDYALSASRVNNIVSLVFAGSAVLIMPLNYYLKKKNQY